MKEFIENWGLIITFFSLVGIEISPIKINPLSWLGSHIGRLINKEINDKVDNLSEKVNQLEKANDFKDILDIKNALSNYHAILRENGLDENQYRRCFELEQKYRHYQDKYNKKEKVVNGHMDAMIENIHENYKLGNVIFGEFTKNKK